MAINDPLGDMLTRIRNAQMRRRPKVVTPASNIRGRVLDVLAEEGYIRGYTRVEQKGALPDLRDRAQVPQRPAGDPRDQARLDAGPARLFAGPGLPTVANGLGVAILSTPKGVMSDSKAREENVGGEVLCSIF